jgi:hypothetical protein
VDGDRLGYLQQGTVLVDSGVGVGFDSSILACISSRLANIDKNLSMSGGREVRIAAGRCQRLLRPGLKRSRSLRSEFVVFDDDCGTILFAAHDAAYRHQFQAAGTIQSGRPVHRNLQALSRM